MSKLNKIRKNLQPKKVLVASMLKRIVDANGGNYTFVRDNFVEAMQNTFPKQMTKEVFQPNK